MQCRIMSGRITAALSCEYAACINNQKYIYMRPQRSTHYTCNFKWLWHQTFDVCRRKIATHVRHVVENVSTKVELFTVFRVDRRRDGRTDRVQCVTRPPIRGPYNNSWRLAMSETATVVGDGRRALLSARRLAARSPDRRSERAS